MVVHGSVRDVRPGLPGHSPEKTMGLIQKNVTQVRGTDWAACERKAALWSMHRGRVQAKCSASSGWGTDVAGCDRRSVRASLEGRGDFRSTWWRLYSRVYLAIVPGANMKRAMYAYHRMHHAITLGWLGYRVSVRTTAKDIRTRGLVVAIKNAASEIMSDAARGSELVFRVGLALTQDAVCHPAADDLLDLHGIAVSIRRRLAMICPDGLPGVAVLAHHLRQAPACDIRSFAGIEQVRLCDSILRQLGQVHAVDREHTEVDRIVRIVADSVRVPACFLHCDRALNRRIHSVELCSVVDGLG
jgi:hypothetical protein